MARSSGNQAHLHSSQTATYLILCGLRHRYVGLSHFSISRLLLTATKRHTGRPPVHVFFLMKSMANVEQATQK